MHLHPILCQADPTGEEIVDPLMSTLAPPLFRGSFRTDQAARRAASGAAGILERVPQAVAVPEDAADVATLVRWAAARKIPLIPRAAATGMPGGNLGEGIAVDLLSRFRHIGPPQAAERRVAVEPGAILAEVNRSCAPVGLFFPIDPSSGERCSLGGMIANNSAGAHGVRYGATREWVEALDVVLADGTPVRLQRGQEPEDAALRKIATRVDALLTPRASLIRERWPRVRKNSSGYALKEYLESGDLLDLLIGSEGTLALIVGAELRLTPIPPHRGLALLEFTSLEAAGEAVAALLPLRPATCEMLDRTFLELVRGSDADIGHPLAPDLEALLLVEVEADSRAEVREQLTAVERNVGHLASGTVTAVDPERQQELWRIRKAASPLIAERTDGRISMQFIEDGVVPIERLPEYAAALRRILRSYDVPAVIFGHAGSGNLHINPLVDIGAPDWRNTIERILYEVAAEVARLGGTLAGEHGDGRLRAPLLETIWGAELVACFRAVKKIFDPADILNPGVILPRPGQRPLDALRPFVPPLAPRPEGSSDT